MQHVAASALAVHGLPTHKVLEMAVFTFLPAGHVVIVPQVALVVQQVAT
jgi:hypothetical protein